ncbi:hypothetical protein QUC31_005854 [Theobroma cacao]
MACYYLLVLLILIVSGAPVEVHGKLSSNYYSSTCPEVMSIVEARGRGGSILLDDNATFMREKTAAPNDKSVKGFDVVDDINAKVEKACPEVVSCADILAIAARDSDCQGGSSSKVKLGRRDSTTASRAAADNSIPGPNFNVSALPLSYAAQGLSLKDLVAFSGSHTFGLPRCITFQTHIYNDSNIDATFAMSLQRKCPKNGKDNVYQPLDFQTPTYFDNLYFKNLLRMMGLLRSDQELFSGTSADYLVKKYAADNSAFFKAFAKSMIKMGNIKPLTAAVAAAIKNETRVGASLLRLHFHDCFVNGCDGSVLLDDNATFIGEKTAVPNNNSARGFNVVDDIKARLEKACPGVVSCADILALASRDSVVQLGGPSWKVRLGRRDSTTASRSAANTSIPPPTSNLSALISSFSAQGLSIKDLVTLSGSHTIGLARCTSFRPHIYNDSNIDRSFAASRRRTCPRSGNDSVLAPLDRQTPTFFDNLYYKNLLNKTGLLRSDQELFNRSSTTALLVKSYATNTSLFFQEFVKSIIKMGNIKPLTGSAGEIRINCRKIN